MEEPHALPDRRSQSRYAVDADATLVVVNKGTTIRGRIFEISLDGCRIAADKRHPFATPGGIEVISKINGIAFRLGGTMQWADNQQTAGVQFAAMAPRRLDALLELLAELAADEQAKAAKEAAGAAADASQENQDGMEPDAQSQVPTAPPPGPPPPPRPVARPWNNLPNPPSGSAAPKPAVRVTPCGRSFGTPTAVSKPPSRTAPSQPASLPPSPAPVPDPACATRRERRAEERHSVDTGATIFFIDVRAQIAGRIIDLSLSGCRIRTDERFPVGIYRRVETEFNVDGLPFRLLGVVQSLHDKFTVGIRFLDMSQRKHDQLVQLMEEIAEMRASSTPS